MPKYQIEVPGQGTFEVESPTDLTDAQAYAAVQNQISNTPKPDNSSDFIRGFKSYMPQTKETFGGVQTLIGAGINKALGEGPVSTSLMERGAKNITEANKEQAKTAKESDSLTSAWEQGIGTVLTDWLPYQMGSGAANILETAATALGGAALGTAIGPEGTVGGFFTGIVGKSLVKKGVKEAAEKILKEEGKDAAQAYIAKETEKYLATAAGRKAVNREIGSLAGMVGQAGFHGAGETTSRALQERQQLGETATDLDLSRLLPAAGGHAIADFIANKIGLGALDGLAKPTQNMLLNVAKGVTVTGAKEVPPELFQSAMERFGAQLPLSDRQAIQEYIDTAGAAFGMSVVPGGIGGIRAKAATQTAPASTPPAAPPAGTQGALFPEGGPTPPTAPAFDEKLLPELRQQYDVLEREIDRLAVQHQQEQDPVKKQAILVQAQKLDFARRELEGQLQGAEPRPGTAPVAGQAELDFTQPFPKGRLQAEPTVIGETKTTPDQQALDLEFAKQRLEAGAPLTPAQQLLLRQQKAPEGVAPQLVLPTEVGAGARPTSFVVDEKALNTFGFSKAANKIRNELRGLDLMKPEDLAKFEEAIAKHERKNAKVDMQAVEDFKSAIPQPVPAREVPEAAGLPAREYTPRQQYQQAREAMFAFGQQAAPISPRDRAFLAKQQYEAENGPVPEVGAGTSEPSVSLPSGELQPAGGATAPATTGLASPLADVGRPTAGTRPTGKAQPTSLDPFAQMVQQVAPKGKPALQEKTSKAKKQDAFSKAEDYQRELNKKSRKGTAYRTAGPNMDGMSVRDVQGVVNRIIDGWKNSPLIQVVQFENQLPQAVQDQIERDGVIRPQGLWDEDTQAVYLIADNLTEPKEVGLTVAHEALGHYGLRTILGENYSKVMNQMYQNAEVKTRADSKIERGMDKETAVEEVLAEMAEKHTSPNIIQKLVNIVRQLMAKAGFPMKGVTNSEIKALLEQSRQYVIEGKGEAGKGGMKVGKVFSGDAPIFYSKLAAMTQHVPKNLRDGASGKAWADWINSNAGKFGVKKEEIEWSGIDDLLALMEKSIKFTSKDVNDMLKEEGVKVGEEVRGIKDEAKLKELDQEERRLNMQAFDLAEEMLAKNVFEKDTWYDIQSKGYNRDKIKPGVQLGDYLENLHVPILQNTFDSSALKPEFANEYTPKISNIHTQLNALYEEQRKAYGKETRFDPYKTHGGENYTELVLTLPQPQPKIVRNKSGFYDILDDQGKVFMSDIQTKASAETILEDVRDSLGSKPIYTHPHWPDTTNPIAHTRFSEFTDADGQRVLLVDEVQSDWGQKGARKGFQTEAAIPWDSPEYRKAREESMNLRNLYNSNNANPEEQARIRPALDRARAAEDAIERHNRAVENKAPKAPFVQDTKVWAALVVKRLLRYAADNGISRIAFIDGQTAYKRFPIDKEGNSTEKGMKTFYDQILPSVVKDVLRKLGADNKPVRSAIESPSPETRIYFLQKDGEDIAGPFDSVDELTQARIQLEKQGIYGVARYETASNYKSFPAYDLTPETAERVKEGQAMFRSTIPRYTKLAEPSTVGNSVRTVLEQVNKANRSNTWENFRIAAVDPSSGLGRVLASLPENDKQLRADLLARAFAQVNNVINNGLQTGIPVLSSDGSVVIKQGEDALAKSRILATQLDSNPEVQAAGLTGMDYIAEIARRLRGKEIMDVDAEIRKKAEDAMKVADRKMKESKNPKISHAESRKLYNEAMALRKRYKDDLTINRELEVKPEDVKWAQEQVTKVPEVKAILDMWRNINEGLIDLREAGGLLNKEEAAALRKNVSYVPLFAAEEDLESMRDPNRAVTGSGTKSVDTRHALKGTDKLQRNIWENLYKQYAITTAAVFQNQVRKIGSEQVISLGGGRFVDNAAQANVRYRDATSPHADSNGIVNAVVDSPNALAAFQVLHYELNPVMKAMAASTRLLRAGALINPMYWVKQLIRDPLHAIITGRIGLITPADSIKEFINVLRKNSKEAEILASHGVIGAVDSTLDLETFLKQVGEKNVDPSKLDKVMHKVMRIHEASDAATRVAIYKKSYSEAIEQGMNEEQAISYGVMKARESANFSVHGNSATLNTLRHMIPFFSAAITSLDTLYRASTGYNLNPEEKAKAKQMFRSRATTMAVMAMVYAMMLQDDEEYKKLPDEVKDANWLLPNPLGDGKSFIKIPVPFEVGFLFKTIPETVVRYLAGNSTGADVLKSYRAGILQNLPGNGIPIPQAGKPILEHMTNYSFFTGRSLESSADQGLPVHMRGSNASETAKSLSKAGLDKLGLSPVELDNYIQGYTAQLGTFATSLADVLINTAEGKSTAAKNIEQLPGFRAFMTNPNVSKAVGDFYTLQREAVEVVHELNQLKKYNRRDELKEFLADDRNKKLIAIEPTLRRIQTQMATLRTQAKIIEDNQALEPEVRRARVNMFMDKYHEVAKQYEKVVKAAKL